MKVSDDITRMRAAGTAPGFMIRVIRTEKAEGQEQEFVFSSGDHKVKIKLNEGDLPAAGKVYRKLKKLAPQSDELIDARELIRAAVIKKGKK